MVTAVAVAPFRAEDDPERAAADLVAVVERESPTTLVIVVEGAPRRAAPLGEWLIEEATAHATNTLGHDLTALAIVLEDPAHRSAVDARIAELTTLRMGGGSILYSEDLLDTSICGLLIEQTL